MLRKQTYLKHAIWERAEIRLSEETIRQFIQKVWWDVSMEVRWAVGDHVNVRVANVLERWVYS